MDQDYTQQDWFKNLNEEDRSLLEKLIEAQSDQGDLNELGEKYQSRCLEYKEASTSCEIAKDLFIEVLEFDDVDIFFNLRKSEIIDKLNALQQRAEEFDEEPD